MKAAWVARRAGSVVVVAAAAMGCDSTTGDALSGPGLAPGDAGLPRFGSGDARTPASGVGDGPSSAPDARLAPSSDAEAVGGRTDAMGGRDGNRADASPCASEQSASGVVIWAKRFGGPGADYAVAAATQASGGFIVGGQFENTLTFDDPDGGAGSLSTFGTGAGFFATFDASARAVVAGAISGSGGDRVNAVASASDGPSFAAGVFSGRASLGGGSGHTLDALAGVDAFLTRYEWDGTVSWAESVEGTGSDTITSVATGVDRVFVAGTFYGSATWGRGAPAEAHLDSLGNRDVFLAAYGSSGSLQWVEQAGTGSVDDVEAVASCSDGSVYMASRTYGNMVFEPGLPSERTLTSGGWLDFVVSKHDANGMVQWATQVGGNGFDRALGIAALPGCAVAVVGQFEEQVVFGKGQPGQVTYTTGSSFQGDSFLAVYEADGQLRWVRRTAGEAGTFANRVAALADGSLVVGGVANGVTTFGPGECAETPLEAGPAGSAFIAKYTAEGRLTWVRRIDGSGSTSIAAVLPRSDGTIGVVGSFGGVISFDSQAAMQALISSGTSDFFLMALRD